MDEMRAAGNQVELERVQKKLARVQRIAEHKSLLANKVLTSTPQWILDEAKKQQEWIAQKKAEKVAQKAVSGDMASTETDASTELHVECLGCGTNFAWSKLAAGDGRCGDCLGLPGNKDDSTGGGFTDSADEPLLVECAKCNEPMPWQLLQLNDGVCSACIESSPTVENASADQPEAKSGSQPNGSSSSSNVSASVGRSSWRSRRREAAAAATTTESGYPSSNV